MKQPVSINDHADFRRSLADVGRLISDDDLDDIDAELDEMIHVDPYNGDPPSKRKDREISRVLGLLDSLERGSR
jgi:hypothetical protein